MCHSVNGTDAADIDCSELFAYKCYKKMLNGQELGILLGCLQNME